MNDQLVTSSATPQVSSMPMVTEYRQYPGDDYLCKTYPAPICYEYEWGEWHQGLSLGDVGCQTILTSGKLSVSSRLKDSSSITAEIEHALRAISGLVHIPRPAEIREYLLRFPDLLSVLPCICFHIVLEFNVDTQISLELFKDRESEERYLSLYVRQKTYSKNIMKQLEKVWLRFESEISKSNGWINITTDFRSPR
jgi:hypothetical protein